MKHFMILLTGRTALVLVMCAFVGFGTKATTSTAQDRDPAQVEPVGQLLEKAAAGADGAFNDLRRRMRDQKMSDAELQMVIDAALERQADRATPWEPAWGDLIELAQQWELLPEEDWQRYLKQALEVELIGRPVIAADGLLVPGSRYDGRFGYLSTYAIWVTFNEVMVEDRRIESPFTIQGGVWEGQWLTGPDAHPAHTAQEFDLESFPKGELRFSRTLSVRIESDDDLEERLLYHDERVLETTVEVAPPGTRTATLKEPDDEIEAVLRERLSIRTPPRIEKLWDYADDRYLFVEGELRPVPVDFAFRIEAYLDTDEEATFFGKLVGAQGPPIRGYRVYGDLGDRAANEVTLRFVPSLDLAEQTLFLTEIWSTPIEVGPLMVMEHDEMKNDIGD